MSRSKSAGISKPNTSTGSTKLPRILYINFCQNNTQNEYYKCIIHSILFSQVPGSFYQTSWHQEETASVWGTIIRVGCNYVASAHQSQDCKGSIESNCLFFTLVFSPPFCWSVEVLGIMSLNANKYEKCEIIMIPVTLDLTYLSLL